jgi:catechol 2,3-dioxygenase-like lactoylglutathione lyase family enzyme
MNLIVNIDVPDLDAATRFYVDAFELRVGRRLGGLGVELLGAAVPIYLLPKAEGSAPFANATEQRHYQRHWTPVHLDIVVGDLGAALARALASGARDAGGVSEHVWGRMALLADPFGHGFCLIELRGRGYDEIATG